jgi:hypothetical protein
MVEISKETTPTEPECILKYFLPNNPSIKKVTSGKRGTNTM